MNDSHSVMKNLFDIKTIKGSRIYRRGTIANLAPTSCHSKQYSRSVARDIFARLPQVDLVEYVTTGNKTDSQIIGRGEYNAPDGCYVYVCSTGGKWGKSSRAYAPAANQFSTASRHNLAAAKSEVPA